MDMTPNNIVNMAYIKGLDIIAVSDHNAAENLQAAASVAQARDILLIPAIEAETREEVHVLCYMPTVQKALILSDRLRSTILDIPYDTGFFGEQVIMDEDDEPQGSIGSLLIQATDLPIDELFSLCHELGGVCVPAHINKSANSILYMLGFIPPDLNVKTIELHRGSPLTGIDTDKFLTLHSSDAHALDAMSERENTIELDEKSVECFLYTIRQGLKR